MAATNNQESLVPKIVLIPHARSHPFAQRECNVNESLKVGRPVDKKKISQNNLIFDCRVLSRNHALIWFENGKFYIRDTKSSNGTFVNECRLSPTGEESSATELKTRDIVQFGVNVNVEKRVTHGCIIATVKLFINEKELPGPDPDIQQVMTVIQNSLAREQEIENKLASMQEVILLAQDLAKDSMISIVKEDELLSRLEMLENQLQVYSRNSNEGELHKQLTKSFEDKHKRELTAKETIQKMIQEKIEVSSKLLQLQRDYDKAEEECQKYRTLYESLKHEHSQQVSKLNELVKNAEKQRTEDEDKSKDEREVWLASKESLQNELDMTRNELEEAKIRLKEKESLVQEPIATSVVTITEERAEDSSTNELKEKLNISEQQIASLKGEIATLNKVHSTLETQLEELKSQLNDKTILVQNKSLALSDMKETIEFQRNELERLRVQRQESANSIDTAVPAGLEQCQGQLLEAIRHTESLDKSLREREQQLNSIEKEKKQLEERLLTVEYDCDQMIERSRERESQLQTELIEVQTEAKSLTSQLCILQETLAESSNCTLPPSLPSLHSSSEVSLLEGPPVADPRLRVLSIITLVSIAVALISVTIAYFF